MMFRTCIHDGRPRYICNTEIEAKVYKWFNSLILEMVGFVVNHARILASRNV